MSKAERLVKLEKAVKDLTETVGELKDRLDARDLRDEAAQSDSVGNFDRAKALLDQANELHPK